ncbi:MAG TPA: hypothetical protein DC042_16355 [Bacteroidales bacterium]|nr:hypothetical protein [Bacteroidales bacterium]
MKKREIIEGVVKIILKHAKPERIWLFGSQASGEAEERSDIDIAWDGPEDDFHVGAIIQSQADELSTLIKIDVKNLNNSDPRFRQRVRDTGRVLWSATKQLRFEDGIYNFSRALDRFRETVEGKSQYYSDGYGDVYLDIAIKRYEFTFEMAWKACKRALDYLNLKCTNPRSCLKEAFAQHLIDDESVWLEMLDSRNLTAHIYNEFEIRDISADLEKYLFAFNDLLAKLETLFSS